MAKEPFNREKIMVKRTEYLESLEQSLIDGIKLKYMLSSVENLVKIWGADAVLELEWDYDNVDLVLRHTRLETDEEHRKRVAKHDAAQERKKSAPAKAEAARLKKIEALKKEASKLGLKVV